MSTNQSSWPDSGQILRHQYVPPSSDVPLGETFLAARSQEKLLFSQANLADTGIQFNSVYTRASKTSTSLPSFGIKGRTDATVTESYFCHFRSNFFPYYELRLSEKIKTNCNLLLLVFCSFSILSLKELHNITTEWLNNTLRTTSTISCKCCTSSFPIIIDSNR